MDRQDPHWHRRLDLRTLAMVAGPPADSVPRDVFLYVISGHNAANPSAAMRLIERLG